MQSTTGSSDATPLPDEIGALVRRLARPHASGGMVIERSVIIAEGARSKAILGWVTAHDGVADATVPGSRSSGLHGRTDVVSPSAQVAPARRYVLPARAFETTP